MELTFYKYQGTGNDFVMIDNRQKQFPSDNHELISFLCDRRFGIGADGLILLEDHPQLDFSMLYYNADGNPSSMCGNGGRCIVAFANYLNIIADEAKFNAVDGLHTAKIKDEIVSLQMKDVAEFKSKENYTFLDTGSPHHVQLVNNLDAFKVAKEGAKLRYGLYGKNGSNINFVEAQDNVFSVRTYERGVEDETLSCGTGVTAVALAMHYTGKTTAQEITIKAVGGALKVNFDSNGEGYTNIFLSGPAKQVFKGTIVC